MARGSSGFRTVIRVAKAIDRANKQAARDAERRRKQDEREQAKQHREHERLLKHEERERIAEERRLIAADKARFKQGLELAKESYEYRVEEREALRIKYIKMELK